MKNTSSVLRRRRRKDEERPWDEGIVSQARIGEEIVDEGGSSLRAGGVPQHNVSRPLWR